MSAIFAYNHNNYKILGGNCEPALKQPLTLDEIKNNFNKSELFNANLDISLDNVFVPKQKLNEFRRTVFDKIYNILISDFKHNEKFIKIENDYQIIKFEDFEIIEDLDQSFNKKNIIYSPEIYTLDNISKFINKCNSLNKKPFLDTPNFALEKDILLLKDIINKTKISIIANNYYALSFNTEIIVGAGLNVYNLVAASVLNKPVITAESSISTKINFPYMTLRHCPMKEHLNARCDKCPYNENYSYKMDNGTKLKLKRKKLSTCTFYLTD